MYHGKKIILRGMTLADVDRLMERWNTLELRKHLTTTLPNSREEEEEFVRSTWESRKNCTGYTFSITDKEDNWLGTIGLHSVDHQNQTAELGIAIHAVENRGKGYGTDAIITMCGVAFKFLNFHRVALEYLKTNSSGAKAYDKAGFTKIGRKREAIFRDGKFIDLITMDILRNEWFEKFNDDYHIYSD